MSSRENCVYYDSFMEHKLKVNITGMIIVVKLTCKCNAGPGLCKNFCSPQLRTKLASVTSSASQSGSSPEAVLKALREKQARRTGMLDEDKCENRVM